MIFKTNRTLVCLLQKSDINDFYEMQSDPEVMKYVKKTMTHGEAEEELNRFINFYNDQSSFFKIWAIKDLEQGEFLGICGVYENQFNEYELATRFRKEFWSNGYGTEILQALIEYCFNVLSLNKLVAYIYAGNIGSIKITQKYMNYVGDVILKKDVEKKFCLKKTHPYV